MVASPTFVIGEERQVVQLVQGEVRELRQSIGETWLLCAPPPSLPPFLFSAGDGDGTMHAGQVHCRWTTPQPQPSFLSTGEGPRAMPSIGTKPTNCAAPLEDQN